MKSSTKYTSNREFARDVLKWAFQRTGALRVVSTNHHRENQTRAEFYRIKDAMVRAVPPPLPSRCMPRRSLEKGVRAY